MGTRVTLRQLWSRDSGRSASEFEEAMFEESLYPHAKVLAGVIQAACPGFFAEDFGFIREAGAVRNWGELLVEMDRFHGRNLRDRNWLRRRLRLRVSSRRVLTQSRDLLPSAWDAGDGEWSDP